MALSLAGEPDTSRVLAQLRAITPGTRKGEADSRVWQSALEGSVERWGFPMPS